MSPQQHSDPTAAPRTVKWAGFVGILQGALGIIAALVMIIQTAQGASAGDAEIHGIFGAGVSGYGTAAWFIIIFGAVLAAGIGLTQGKRWGRAPVAMMSMLLLPVAWYMYSSGRIELAIPTTLIGLIGLVFLFNKEAISWAATKYNG